MNGEGSNDPSPFYCGCLVKVIGFDPSLTNFGWTLVEADAMPGSLVKCHERGRFQTSSKTLFIDRYCELRARVIELIQKHNVRRIGCEFPVFGESYSSQLYALFIMTCEALRLEKCDVVFFSPGQGKAQAKALLNRPKGWKMMKPDMVEAAHLATNHTGKMFDHNEADAYWIARTASRFWLLHDGVITKAELTPLEEKQFNLIHTYTRGKRAGETVERGILYREDERFFRWSQETTDVEIAEDR